MKRSLIVLTSLLIAVGMFSGVAMADDYQVTYQDDTGEEITINVTNEEFDFSASGDSDIAKDEVIVEYHGGDDIVSEIWLEYENRISDEDFDELILSQTLQNETESITIETELRIGPYQGDKLNDKISSESDSHDILELALELEQMNHQREGGPEPAEEVITDTEYVFVGDNSFDSLTGEQIQNGETFDIPSDEIGYLIVQNERTYESEFSEETGYIWELLDPMPNEVLQDTSYTISSEIEDGNVETNVEATTEDLNGGMYPGFYGGNDNTYQIDVSDETFTTSFTTSVNNVDDWLHTGFTQDLSNVEISHDNITIESDSVQEFEVNQVQENEITNVTIDKESGNVTFTFTGLDPNTGYTVYDNGEAVTSELSDSNGELEWTKDGDWSPHTITLEEGSGDGGGSIAFVGDFSPMQMGIGGGILVLIISIGIFHKSRNRIEFVN